MNGTLFLFPPSRLHWYCAYDFPPLSKVLQICELFVTGFFVFLLSILYYASLLCWLVFAIMSAGNRGVQNQDSCLYIIFKSWWYLPSVPVWCSAMVCVFEICRCKGRDAPLGKLLRVWLRLQGFPQLFSKTFCRCAYQKLFWRSATEISCGRPPCAPASCALPLRAVSKIETYREATGDAKYQQFKT